MTNFNIQNSKIEQLNESGNNYKIQGSGNNTISENGNVVQVVGDNNKVPFAEPKKSVISTLLGKLSLAWKWLTSSS